MLLKWVLCLLLGGIMSEAGIKEAQKKYDSKLYREALVEFEKEYEKTKSEESYVMSLASRLMLREFENNLKAAKKAPKFKIEKWEFVYKAIYIKSVEKFIDSYSGQLPRTEIKGATEPIKLTYPQWRNELYKLIESLLEKKDALLTIDIDSVSSIFYFKNVDIEAMPTMLDWTINELTTNHHWMSYPHLTPSKARELGIKSEGKNRKYIRDYWRMADTKFNISAHDYFYFEDSKREIQKLEWDTYKKNKVLVDKTTNDLETPRGKAEWLVFRAKFHIRYKEIELGMKLCRQAMDALKSDATQECLDIIGQVERKEFNSRKSQFNSKVDVVIPITTRNLKKIYVNVYPIGNHSLQENFDRIKKNESENELTEEEIKQLVKKPSSLEKKVNLETKEIYFDHMSELKLGKLKPGRYWVVISDSEKIDFKKSFFYGNEIKISDIQLVHQLAGHYDPEKSLGETEVKTIPAHHFFVFDTENGKLLPDIPLKIELKGTDYTLKTNSDGGQILSDTWNFQPLKSNNDRYSAVKSVAQLDNSVSIFRSDYINKPTFHHLKFVSEYDRPIYRPGQKVSMKLIILRRVPFGYRVLANASVDVRIRNPQYQIISETKLKANAQGAVSWEYELPMSGMLGQYQTEFIVEAPELQNLEMGKTHSDYFKVEEYKRPDYYVEIEKPKEPWVLDKEVKVKFSSKYYYGAPVKNGKVNYTINSSYYYPWFYHGYGEDRGGGGVSFSGSGTLDDKGEMTFSYVPKSDGADSRSFSISVSVFDESGRSIDAHANYVASKNEFFINAMAKKDFFKNNENANFTVKLENPNGALFDASVDYEVFEVQPASDAQRAKFKENPHGDRYGRYHDYSYSSGFNYEHLFGKLETKSVVKGKWDVKKDKSDFKFSSLGEGIYKVVFNAQDSNKNKTSATSYFMIAETGKRLSQHYIPEVTLMSQSEYKIGETGTIVFGSSEYSGNFVGFLLKNQLKLENPIFKTTHGIKVYDFKVTESMFNGVSFTWFSVFDSKIVDGRSMIKVNNDYKAIDIQFDKTSKIKPGQSSQLKVVTKSKTPNLEALLTMYDQSLEFYSKRDNDYLKLIYANSDGSQPATIQLESLRYLSIDWEDPDLVAMLKLFEKKAKKKFRPVLLIDAQNLRYEDDDGSPVVLGGASSSKMRKSAIMASSESMASPRSMADREMKESAPSMDKSFDEDQSEVVADGSDGKSANGKNEAGSPKIEVRKNFAETAVYAPFFSATTGASKYDFKAPDQLTAWKAKLLAISETGLIGQDEQVIQSQKDFFVRVLISRYFREGDMTEIKLKVDNLTNAKMPTQMSLNVEGIGIDISEMLKGQNLKHSLDIDANGTYTHTWKFKVPSVLGSIKIKGIAIANNETDAEEKTISILPSRQRLMENTLVYLKEKQNILKVRNWDKKDSTRINELMSVQIDPQLPIMLLNSVPTLVNYPYSCTEQLMNKYVPLAIINSLYQQNPKLKEAVASALKTTGTRKTITLPWEEKDPRRMMELTETPWIVNSKGYTSSYDLISYLDAPTIEKIRNEIFKDLKTRQTPSGGFTWFPGGTEDLYITLIVLEGISEAAQYGVEFPKDLYAKALDYVYKELPKYLKGKISELQFVIFGTYIFTSFDSKMNHLSHNKEVADVWIPFIEKFDTMITPLGHAYMAHIYSRLGKKAKMEISLKRAMDGSKKDDLIGIYWAPEERSWMWYSDTVEKHAFFLQTLIQLAPKDEKIDGLVQWLLFNRKGNEWKSTKATSKAIFSLMHYLKLKTGFTDKTELAIEWGSRKEKLVFDPLEVSQKEPLRYLKTESFTANDGQVSINKTGKLPVFASMTWIYSTDAMVDASGSSVMDLKREFNLVKKDGSIMVPLKSGDKVVVGEEIEVVLTIKSKSELEYVHLKDPRGAGFESNSLVSGYQWDSISRYQEPRDSLMNFFFGAIPKGEYMMRHRFKATTPGSYKFNSATIQSMYAPEMTAYSSTFKIDVVEK